MIDGSAVSAGTPSGITARTGAPLCVAEVVSALSFALDLVTGQPMGHSVRTCVLGMRLASEIHLSPHLQNDLYYALLLKDAGCSSNASAHGKSFSEGADALPRGAATRNEQRHITKIRAERGAALARMMGLSERTAQGIASVDEHWNGGGNPRGLRQTGIPIVSRIILLAQTLETGWAAGNQEGAMATARERSNCWFDPDLVKAAESLSRRTALWNNLGSETIYSTVVAFDTNQKTMIPGDATLDSICLAFADIVDSKSPFTYQHSNGVANAAVAIARTLGLPAERIRFMRHAGLLHDLGKLSVPNAVLEKPGKLDAAEWEIMRLHPYYTWKILSCISGFRELSEVTAAHHEKLDGTGYFRGLRAPQLSLEMRILTVADIFDALSAKRPYRDALPLETVLKIMRKDAPHALDAVCLEALEQSGVKCDHSSLDLQTLSEQLSMSQRY
jgi:HD-GYP domain-containing protein (c-di-GMP phosphodiesterase class II)